MNFLIDFVKNARYYIGGTTVERVEHYSEYGKMEEIRKADEMETLRKLKPSDWFIIKARRDSEISVEETHRLLQEKELIVLFDIGRRKRLLIYIEGNLPSTGSLLKGGELLPSRMFL
jgi:hypothetical protein